MSRIDDKYRSSKEYLLVYSELINAARYRGTVTYQEMAQVLGLPLTGNYMGCQIGHVLGSISEDEHELGRPMLSAVAVGVSGKPGDGFYGFARDLDRFDSEDKDEKRRFWEAECQEVYKTWARPLREPRAAE